MPLPDVPYPRSVLATRVALALHCVSAVVALGRSHPCPGCGTLIARDSLSYGRVRVIEMADGRTHYCPGTLRRARLPLSPTPYEIKSAVAGYLADLSDDLEEMRVTTSPRHSKSTGPAKESSGDAPVHRELQP